MPVTWVQNRLKIDNSWRSITIAFSITKLLTPA